MFVNHVTLSGGKEIPIHHQAREILHALVCRASTCNACSFWAAAL